MNRRGQTGIIAAVFGLIAYVILWALFIGQWLTSIGQEAITTNGFTGLEAFLWANLNLWTWCGILIAFMAITYFGGGQ